MCFEKERLLLTVAGFNEIDCDSHLVELILSRLNINEVVISLLSGMKILVNDNMMLHDIVKEIAAKRLQIFSNFLRELRMKIIFEKTFSKQPKTRLKFSSFD